MSLDMTNTEFRPVVAVLSSSFRWSPSVRVVVCLRTTITRHLIISTEDKKGPQQKKRRKQTIERKGQKNAHAVRLDPARAPGEHRAVRRDERPTRPTARIDPAPARQPTPARGPLEHVQPALPRAHLCRQIRHRCARAATRPGACDEGAEARGGAEEEVRAARAAEGASRVHGRYVCRSRRWHLYRRREWWWEWIDGGRDEGVARDALDGVPDDAGERWEERAAAARVCPA